MIKKICFSLWGNNPKYTIGAIKNAKLVHKIYPGWKAIFYVGNDVPDEILKQIEQSEGELIFMNDSGWNGMFWRFYSADSYDVVLSRDTDSRLNVREKAAVNEWLNSDKDFHIMRDHPYHATVILGGMWGCRNGILRGITEMIEQYDTKEYNDKYQVDQNFLREMIYPLVKNRAMVHDEFFEKNPFPTKRINSKDFVGQVYDHLENQQFAIG